MVELAEFPDIAEKYNIQGVPRIVINEKHVIVGEIPEDEFAREILRVVDTQPPAEY
jgi:predicted DsbA family dithiol-disulfide isomerase